MSLATLQASREQIDVMLDRVGEVLLHHTKRLDAARPLAEQFKSLAVDAYLQGLIDGANVGGVRSLEDIRRVTLGATGSP
jgi:hypothetical protein